MRYAPIDSVLADLKKPLTAEDRRKVILEINYLRITISNLQRELKQSQQRK